MILGPPWLTIIWRDCRRDALSFVFELPVKKKFWFSFSCMHFVFSLHRGNHPIFSCEVTPSQVWPEMHLTLVYLYSHTGAMTILRYGFGALVLLGIVFALLMMQGGGDPMAETKQMKELNKVQKDLEATRFELN